MAAPLTFGPIYCEDAIALSSFPIEPVNTISNLAIVLFGVAALYYAAKRAPKSGDLFGLGAILVANGIGSLLWHGLREGWALAFDVAPGLLFLFTMSFLWARRLWSMSGATIFFGTFLVAFFVSAALFSAAPRFVSIAPAVIIGALLLIGQTATRSKSAALWGLAAISSSVTALVFRSVDLSACDYIAVGTHFLWHIFNSAGAFMGVIALVTLQNAAARPQPAAAE